jgi:hypothetical protein
MTRPAPCETCGGPAADEELDAAYQRADENEHAAQLWRRLATVWESGGGSGRASDDSLAQHVGALMDEWQAPVGKPGAAG